MSKEKRYLALDFGVGSSIAMAGIFDGERLVLEDLHRFNIEATTMLGTSYWDFPAMMIHARTGLQAFRSRYGTGPSGLGCDSWSSDFGLLDKTGHLLANPVHHADPRTEGAVEKLHQVFPDRSLYQRTGVRARREGTLFQLFSMAQSNSPLLDKAVTMLLMADLVAYFLTGIPVQEYTLASTSGMYDMETRDWSRDIILGAKIPPGMMPEVIAPGTVIGTLLDSVADECGFDQVPVIAPASHGMACALAGVPDSGDDWVCILAGYWSQVTVELADPIINDASFGANFSNLGGVDGSIRLQKEVPGLGLLADCAHQWSREDGKQMTLADVLRMAEDAGPQKQAVYIDKADVDGVQDVPAVIRRLLEDSGQSVPSGRGELARVYVNSAVLAQAEAVRELTELTGRKYSYLYFAGRGADAPLFSQSLCDASGLQVKTGPVEGRGVGNILMQMLALGDIGSLAQGRELAAKSIPVKEYTPGDTDFWHSLAANLYRSR